MKLDVRRGERFTVQEVAASSQHAFVSLERNAAVSAQAELSVATLRDTGFLLGAFERHVDAAAQTPVVRRASGGGTMHCAPGSVYCALSMSAPDALVECDEARLLNRYVRPALRALSRFGAPVHYFGRDWLSAKKHPVAMLGYAFDSRTRRVLIEVMVGVATPCAAPTRLSFDGREPAALATVAGKSLDPSRVAAALIEAYGSLATELHEVPWLREPCTPELLCPPWDYQVDEAIGLVGAGFDAHGAIQIGGEFCAAHDVVADLARAATARMTQPTSESLGELVNRYLAPRSAALFGVRTLSSFETVLTPLFAA